MGISESDFWNATLRTLVNRMTGYRRRVERERRETWERVRWQTSILARLQVSNKDAHKLNKVLRLPWDEDEKPKRRRLTPEQEAARRERFRKWDEMKRKQHGIDV